MARETQQLTGGDRCPNCGQAPLLPDPAQSTAFRTDRHRRVAQYPAASARYAELAQEKAAQYGEIHRCPVCGYQARVKAKDAGDAAPGGETRPGAAAAAPAPAPEAPRAGGGDASGASVTAWSP
jgi:hypothetical protein